MITGLTIIGIEAINLLFSRPKTEAELLNECSVSVVYGMPYAIFVHENLQAHHVTGIPKFLELPARAHANEIGQRTAEDVKNGMSIPDAMYQAALFLMMRSKALAPVDTGLLRGSVYLDDDFEGFPVHTTASATRGYQPAKIKVRGTTLS